MYAFLIVIDSTKGIWFQIWDLTVLWPYFFKFLSILSNFSVFLLSLLQESFSLHLFGFIIIYLFVFLFFISFFPSLNCVYHTFSVYLWVFVTLPCQFKTVNIFVTPSYFFPEKSLYTREFPLIFSKYLEYSFQNGWERRV